MGEVERDAECEALMEIGMDRIGHGTFLPDSVYKTILRKKIPVEICLTSNLLCGTVSEASDHHFLKYRKDGIPCVLCVSFK